MNKPIPSTEAVDAAAERYWLSVQRPSIGNDNGLNLIPWSDATHSQRYAVRDMILPLLSAAYPQIVADILNHIADKLSEPTPGDGADEATAYIYGEWLRAQANEALS